MIWTGPDPTYPHFMFSPTHHHSEILMIEAFHLERHCGRINTLHLASFLFAQGRDCRKGPLWLVGLHSGDQGTTVSELRTQSHQQPVSPTSPADLRPCGFWTMGSTDSPTDALARFLTKTKTTANSQLQAIFYGYLTTGTIR